MAKKKTKLELTWIGKGDRTRPEPRILLEDNELSFSSSRRVTDKDRFDNLLVHGDNLLALKALQQEFAGAVQCVYIDPPYNTGSAFAEYEDGLEHSLWLSLMRERLEALRSLLASSGSLWVQLDDNEAHYCKVLLDEVFGRKNFVADVIWKKSYAVRSNARFFSTSHEHLLVYAKDEAELRMGGFARTPEQSARFKNPDKDPRGPWQSVAATISLVGGARGRQYAKTGTSPNIFEVQSPSGKTFMPPKNRCWFRSPEKFTALDEEGRIWWGPNGDRAPRYKKYLADSTAEVLPTTLWDDGNFYGFNQDGVRELRELNLDQSFPTPKPEKLIARVLGLATQEGDLVLDSFLGSGTTAAVAHKMGRRWIGVELEGHAQTLCAPRLRKVIKGEDLGGVTGETSWKGGGGFRFLRLAPSLLERDKWGNWVISKSYNKEMLAEAMCKLQGFTYSPSPTTYWQHGKSTERDFIFVTTQSLGHEQLQVLSADVGPDRSLLICCSAFRADQDEFENLTITKIPAAVLSRCEWGRDDYSLNVESVLREETPLESDGNTAEGGEGASSPTNRKRKSPAVQEMTLFGEEESQ